MASNQAAFGGSLGGGFRLVLESHEVQVDTVNNRSLIEITLYMTCVQNEGHVYDQTGAASWSMSGTETGSGNFTYDFNPGVGQNVYFLNNAQYWVGHNNDGTGSITLSASCNADNSPYVTTASVSLSYSLTTIQRYANITNFTVTNVTDVGFTINASTGVTCSQIQYTLDNGVTWHTVSGSASSWTIPITNEPSGATFNVNIIVTDAASGLTTQGSTHTVTTLLQNNFIPFL